MIALALLLAGAAGEPARLERGTEVVLATVAPISSRGAVKGDRVALALVEPVVRDGIVLAAAGAPAVGELTRAEAKGAFGAAGKLEVRLLYMTVDGRPVRIAGVMRSGPRAATGAAVVAGAAVGGLAFVITGRSAVIPAGTRVLAEVVSDAGLAR